MELRHLRYFLAVAEQESVRSAAKRVNVTQPAISRQIKSLEEELGFALFDRAPRGLKLTAAGRFYLGEARRLLAELQSAGRVGARIADGLMGHLRIGLVENAGWDGLVPELFAGFQSAAPDVRLELVPLNTPAQLERLGDGTLDGGLVHLFDEPPAAFDRVVLLEHGVALAVPSGWDLPADGPVRARDLADRPFVTFPRSAYPDYYDRLLAACRLAGLTPRIVQEVSTEAAILSLVSAGIGAAIVNAANRGRPPARARFLDLADVDIRLPLSFVWRRDDGDPALRRFLDVVAARR